MPSDPLLTAAARALAAGRPLDTLNAIATRKDADALAVRGIALAQMGEFASARALLRRAARAFGVNAPLRQARCVVALADIALAARDLRAYPRLALDDACDLLSAHGDRTNAAHGHLLRVRALLLGGHADAAAELSAVLDTASWPAPQRALHALLLFDLALRRLDVASARAALARARRDARACGISALIAEVDACEQRLAAPAARWSEGGTARPASWPELAALTRSAALIVDARNLSLTLPGQRLDLATRPLLFALARVLADAWPGDIPRGDVIAQVFRVAPPDDTHRARLRVEMGRLRAQLRPFGIALRATAQGYRLVPEHIDRVVVLSGPEDGRSGDILALLADGQPWSSSALALALRSSQRTVQRALEALTRDGSITAYGHGRTRRWHLNRRAAFAPHMLLTPAAPPH
ncbi:helix-turn-helix domain-containing protein [Pseudomonadota bacterium AL_CKDN230030165-1A_HGKHYDSX7]